MHDRLPVPVHHQSSRNALKIPANIERLLPEAVRDELARMPDDQQRQFAEGFRHKARSLAMAYLCSLIYCHYILLGRWAMSGWMLLSLFVSSMLGFIWWLIDLVRMPGMVREYNHKVATDTLRMIRIARANPAPFQQA